MHQKPTALKWILWVILLSILTACRATADLGETTWALVAYGPADAPIPAEVPASITFEANGRFSGFDGCNQFFGNYRADAFNFCKHFGWGLRDRVDGSE